MASKEAIPNSKTTPNLSMPSSNSKGMVSSRVDIPSSNNIPSLSRATALPLPEAISNSLSTPRTLPNPATVLPILLPASRATVNNPAMTSEALPHTLSNMVNHSTELPLIPAVVLQANTLPVNPVLTAIVALVLLLSAEELQLGLLTAPELDSSVVWVLPRLVPLVPTC